MLIYPIGESKTEYTFAPWATLILLMISVVGFALVTSDLNKRVVHNKERAKEELNDAVRAQFAEGKLDNAYWLRFEEDHSVVAHPELGQYFSQEARLAWISYNENPPPLSLLEKSRPQNLLLSLVAHNGFLFFLGLVCLAVMGYLFEHQYDRQVILALFIATGCSWVTLQEFVPKAFAPSPVFAWSNTVLVLLLIGWLTAPRANITFAVKGWFIKGFGGEFEVPSMVFPSAFLVAYILITWFLTPYQPWFDTLHLVVVGAEAILFTLLLVLVPARPTGRQETPEQIVNRRIAEAKQFFDRENNEEGLAVLRELVVQDLERSKLREVAELAWKNDASELVDQCYRTLLRKTQSAGEEAVFLEIVSEMLFRHIPLSGNFLVRAIELASKSSRMSQVNKLLPHLLDNKELNLETIGNTMTHLAENQLERKEPDRRFLLVLKNWFDRNLPDAPIVQDMSELFLSGSTESKLTGAFEAHKVLHRMVAVDLLEVQPNRVVIQVKGQKEQHIPWTAFTAIFGCHIAGNNRGYRGCLIINFKRKTFGCTFSTSQILMREGNEPMTFEKAWIILKEHIPEDLPFVPMSAFPSLKEEADIKAAVEEFINQEDQ